MWFDFPDDHSKPIRPWVIFPDMGRDSIEFWFETDWQMAMAHIIEDYDWQSFDIWYFAECGRDFPDIEEIRNKCPLTLTREDTAEDINKKLNELFLIQYRKVHK